MKRYLILLLFVSLSAQAVFAQIELQPVAIVRLTKSEPITVRQLRTELENLAWQDLVQRLRRPPTSEEVARTAHSSTVEQRRQVLDVMINERLAMQAAERDKVAVTDNELNQHIQQMRQQMAQSIGRVPTEAEFAEAIKNETGQEFPAFREALRRQATVQRYMMSQKESLFKAIAEPTEAEIVNFHNLSRSRFVRPETVRFSMISVPYGPDAASRSRAQGIADRLNKEIASNSAAFENVAMRAQLPNADFHAGDGGFLPRNMQAQQMTGAAFMTAAFSLGVGEVSGLLEGPQAYHIIKVTETFPHANLELNDIFDLGSSMTVRQFIWSSLYEQRQQEVLVKAQQELITELRSGNPFQIMENNLNW
ncbi:MAG: peptidyl-prolyl cis-trans isomerase [Treponema sp.]|nr:peptidyl-prolyl cis-trans isomerase [Treponema sp.]